MVASILALMTMPPSGATTTTEWFEPGVPHSYNFADPSLTSFGPMTWAYSTNQGGSHLPAMWSADNKTFTARVEAEGSAAFDGDPNGYANDAFHTVPWGVNGSHEMWAPSVAFVGTHWVSFHAVKIAQPPNYSSYGRLCIFVATSASPMGPFNAASANPIVCPSASIDPAGAIDPEVFVDETTDIPYLLWKTEGSQGGNYQKVFSRQLNSTGTAFAAKSSDHLLLMNSPGSWEGTVLENPSLTKVNGTYVLLFSGNNFNTTRYATGYAICSGPLGPCTKSSANPILTSAPGAWGPGGADGMVDARGRFIAMYQAWTGASGSAGTGQRKPHVAELAVAGGRVSVVRRDMDGAAGPDSLWSFGSGLAHSTVAKSVGGTYVPASGDFDGDGRADVFWYGTWGSADALWGGTSTAGAFTNRAVTQSGSFLPVTGDFNGDGRSDIFWYQPGGDPKVADRCCSGTNYQPNARHDQLWLGQTRGRWTVGDLSMVDTAIPLAGDFNGDGTSDILWYQPGVGADTMWQFHNGVPTKIALTITGNYRPVVGDFDGNGTSDLFWYGPGAKMDSIWWFDARGGHTSVVTKVSGESYRPFAGDFDGDGADELFWYAPGTGADYLWKSLDRAGHPISVPTPVNGVFTPVVGDFNGNRTDDIMWYS